MQQTSTQVRHLVRHIAFPQEVKQEVKKKKDQERWRKRPYERCEIKWRTTDKEDMKHYKRACKNAQKLGIPLNMYLKKKSASETEMTLCLTESGKELIRRFCLTVRNRKPLKDHFLDELEYFLYDLLKRSS